MHNLSVLRLPPAVSTLETGGIYLLAHEPLPLVQTLIWELLLQAAQEGEASWIVWQDAEQAIAASGQLQGRLRAALGSQRLRLFTCSDGPTNPEEFIQTLLTDLTYFRPSRNSLLLIDQVDRLLPPDSTQAQLNGVLLPFKHWAEKNQIVIVLCYPTPLVNTLESLPLFRGQGALAGVSFLSRAGYGVVYHARYWLSLEAGLVTERRYRLAHNSHGSVEVEDELAQHTSTGQQHEKQELVLITRTALMDRTLPQGWRLLDSNADFLQESADHDHSVFILHYDRQTNLVELTTAVYQLRRRFGLHIRIVVREINTQLRYSQVHVLLIAGANMVIPALLSFSHLRGMLEGLMGHVFSRPLADNLEDLIALHQPASYRGLVGLPQFVEAVTKTLEVHQLLLVQDALVVLPIAKGVSFSNVTQALNLTRTGDLCTRSNAWVYLFFSACHEENVTLALERSFLVPYTELFDGEMFYLSKVTIQHQINELAIHEDADPLLDTLDPVAVLLDEPVKKLPSGQMTAPPAAKRRPIALRPEPKSVAKGTILARR